MFVANANEDTVSVFDITSTPPTKKEDISVKPDSKLPFGSMPNGLTLSPDEKTLYVANGGNNAVAVIALGTNAAASADSTDAAKKDAATSSITGFIPTEWFPIGVAVSADGGKIYVANNKGEGSVNNDPDSEYKSVYAVTGSVTFVDKPTANDFKKYKRQLEQNNQYEQSLAESFKKPNKNAKAVPVPAHLGEPSTFKHVLYILKENRTYDQIFGDMGVGNSDPELAMFGQVVTPNHHALAKQFGLLDNCYASSVNSADGHQWDGNAVATVFAERIFNIYPSNSPFPGLDSYQDSALDLTPTSIYSNLAKKGISLRNYGEQANFRYIYQDGKPIAEPKWLDTWRDRINKSGRYDFTAKAWVAPLDDNAVIDRKFPPFGDIEFSDQHRADEFEREFNGFVANNTLPQFMVMQLTNDHTNGTSPNFPTPEAMVADNDYALGRVVDLISHSKYWQDTAIFVIEDDAQNGVDHVDGHRTSCLVISAYNKKGKNGKVFVDSNVYNQTSMIRTMEQIFGAPPINQFDLIAPTMTNLFDKKAAQGAFSAIPPSIPLDTMNRPITALSGQAKIDALTSIDMPKGRDRDDPRVMNEITWRAVKGANATYPHFAWEKNSRFIKEDDGDAE